MPKPEELPINKIYVPVKKKKTVKAEVVREIAESILEIGQQVPIVVRTDEDRYVLVEGLHRLEACNALGEKTIIGLVISAEAARHRAPLTPEAEAQYWKMERLRRLRLQREAAEKSAAAAHSLVELGSTDVRHKRSANDVPGARPNRSARRTAESKPKTLLEWFARQERDGFHF